jgi:3-oxoacyl-[acyl-carrier-protein] synthase-3
LKGEGLATSDMAVEAVSELLRKRGITANDLDLIIFCTITADKIFPSSACILADKIGAKNAFGYDLAAACSGFLFGLETATRFIESGRYKNVLLVGGDRMSSIIDYTDRNTCIIFGDGLGCVLLEPTEEENIGVIDSVLKIDGSGRNYLYQKAGGSQYPPTHETIDAREHFVYQDGKTVFKFAVKGMADVSAQIMERNNLTADDIAWLVPHQANLRIIDATAERMGLGKDKVMINIDHFSVKCG